LCIIRISNRSRGDRKPPYVPPYISGRELRIGGLRGVKEYSIYSSFRGPRELGISAASLRDRVKLRLREAGVGVIEGTGDSPGTVRWPQLKVDVEMAGPASDESYTIWVTLKVADGVRSTRASAQLFEASVYDDRRLFLSRRDTVRDSLRLTMDELLDAFLSAHLEMNPK
jgi:hypothetical protein